MLVSVIIPAYNCAKYLPSTLESVKDQRYQNLEIIAVNDGSTDNTVEVLEPFLNDITYISQNNQGVSAARNKAISQSNGDLIAFIDADDNWNPDKLWWQVDVMTRHNDIAGVFSDFAIANQEGEITSTHHVKINYRVFSTYNLDWRDIFPHRELLKHDSSSTDQIDTAVYTGNMFKGLFLGNFINTSSIVLRKSTINKYGMFNPDRKTQEDYEYWLKIAKDESFAYIDTPLLYSRRRENQLTSLSNQEDISKNSLEVIEELVERGVSDLIDKRTVALRLSDRYNSYAMNLLRSGNKSKARSYIIKSLYAKKSNLKTIALYIWSFVPKSVENFTLNIYRSIRN